MPKKTSFAQWLQRCDLTPTEAAEQLGIGHQRTHELIRGKAYTKGRAEAKPDLLTRFAMAAIADRIEIDRSLAPFERSRRDRRLLLGLSAAMKRLEPWPE